VPGPSQKRLDVSEAVRCAVAGASRAHEGPGITAISRYTLYRHLQTVTLRSFHPTRCTGISVLSHIVDPAQNGASPLVLCVYMSTNVPSVRPLCRMEGAVMHGVAGSDLSHDVRSVVPGAVRGLLAAWRTCR
jgi:hypothetical protein